VNGAQEKTANTYGAKPLAARQRKVLPLFDEWAEITTPRIAELLKLSPRGARALAQKS
jgi:hypothetical protein